MGQLCYITQDFRNMTEAEREKKFICQGSLSMFRLYQFMFGKNHQPTAQETRTLRTAYARVNHYLTRCQMDLLHAEFGADKVPFSKAELITDALLCEPPEANIEKLKQAVQRIKNAYQSA